MKSLKNATLLTEIGSHLLALIILAFYLVAPSFNRLGCLLILQWILGVVNTAAWWKRISHSEKQNDLHKPPSGV